MKSTDGANGKNDASNNESNQNEMKISDENVSRDFKIKKNKKGGFNIVRDGHIYLINKRNPSTIGWECLRRKIYKCRGGLTSNAEMTKVIRSSPHNHEPINAQ